MKSKYFLIFILIGWIILSCFTNTTKAADENEITSYIISPFNDTKILPKSEISETFKGTDLEINLSKGEHSSSSFVLTSNQNISNIQVTISNFTNGMNTLPANICKIRTVKCWYQAGYDNYNYVRADYWNHSLDAHFLTPELLLNNSSIVRVDGLDWTDSTITNPNGKNYLVLKNGNEMDITVEQDQDIAIENIHDASTLQPIDLIANYNQQFYLTYDIPLNVESGVYTATIIVSNETKTFKTLNVTLKILPYSLDTSYENSIQFQPSISEYPISPYYTPEANYVVYLKSCITHGISNPMLWIADNTTLCRELEFRQQLGFNNSNMYYHGTLPIADYHAYKNMFSPYGVVDIYLYGPDEQEINVSQVQAEHIAGYKHFDTQSLYITEHPDLLDLTIEYSRNGVQTPNIATATTYHSYNHRIFSYGNPQTVPEWPRTWRYNYGLLLWQANYDGACPFAWCSWVGDAWNDFCDTTWWERQSMLVYQYDTGVVDTVQYEGFAEGINDVKYARTLQTKIDTHANSNDPNITSAHSYLTNLKTSDLSNVDLDVTKTTLQNYITILETYNETTSENITSYVVPAISDTLRILPNSTIPNSYASNNLLVNVSKGETTDCSFVLNPKQTISNCNLSVSSFISGSNTLPVSAIDIKYVVPWYYGTTDNFDEHITGRYLQPDLLVYDRSLIIANETQGGEPTAWNVSNPYGKNYLKLATGEYQDISTSSDNGYDGALASNRPIYDANTLQATDLILNHNQQYIITLRIPNNTIPGMYNGTITVTDGINNYKTINASIKVLPFELNNSIIEYGLFYHSYLDPKNQAHIGWQNKSETQLMAEFKDLIDHGITHPLLNPGNWYDDQDPNGINDSAIIHTLELRQSAGINDSNLYYWSNAKNDNTTILHYKNLFAPYTDQLYMYGKDETAVNRSVLAYEHSIGVKHFNAQSITLAWGDDDILDYCICLSLDPTTATGFHENNYRISNYHQPQSAINYPELYRKNAGVVIWQNNYDGWFDFAYQWHNGADLWQTTYSYDNLVPYVFAYPTANGVIDTMKWEGVREAVIDTKYITTLQNKINENNTSATAIEAQAYLNTLKSANPSTLNMDIERTKMQNYLTALYPVKEDNSKITKSHKFHERINAFINQLINARLHIGDVLAWQI